MSNFEYREMLKKLEADGTPEDIKTVILSTRFPHIHNTESLNDLADEYQTIKKYMDLQGFQKFILSNNNIVNDESYREKDHQKEDSQEDNKEDCNTGNKDDIEEQKSN
jgi:hypothetical protein